MSSCRVYLHVFPHFSFSVSSLSLPFSLFFFYFSLAQSNADRCIPAHAALCAGHAAEGSARDRSRGPTAKAGASQAHGQVWTLTHTLTDRAKGVPLCRQRKMTSVHSYVRMCIKLYSTLTLYYTLML